MAIDNIALASGNNDLLVVPALKTYTSVNIFFCNKDASTTEYISIYAVKNGESASDSVNIIAKDVEIEPKDTFTYDVEKIILGPQDKIVVAATVGALVIATISYIELT